VLQNELAKLFNAILMIINYDFIEKECEQNVLLLSEKMQQKSNKITAVRLIKYIAEVGFWLENIIIFFYFVENKTKFLAHTTGKDPAFMPGSGKRD